MTKYLNYQEFRRAQRADFDHTCRLILIEWSTSVIRLAPLPEFKEAIALIEEFDQESGSKRSRLALACHYHTYFSRKHWNQYGYSPIGAIFSGLQKAVYKTLHPNGDFDSDYGHGFSEACYVATEIATKATPSNVFMGLPEQAQRAEQAWQDVVWQKHWDSHNKEFGFSWTEQKARQAQEAEQRQQTTEAVAA